MLLPLGLDVSPRWSQEPELVLCAVEAAVVDRVAEQITRAGRTEFVPKFRFLNEWVRHPGLSLVRKFEQDVPPDLVYADSLMHTRIAHLIKFHSARSPTPPTIGGGLSSTALQRAAEYMNAHLGGTLAREAIAEAAGDS